MTLELLNAEPGPQMTRALNQIVERFEADNPDVDVDIKTMSFDDLLTTVRMTLSDDDPPDIVQNSHGYQSMGPLVEAQLLFPLDKYAERYGWYDKQSESLMRMGEYTPDGKTWGSGSLYGTSLTTQFIGVYYNRKELEQLGLEVPETLAEFEAALAAPKQADLLPLLFGGLEKWPVCNAFQALAT